MARTLAVSPATVRRWLERARKHARAFGEEHDRVEDPSELQFDELSGRSAKESRSPWIFNALEVASRYWAASVVGTRSHRRAEGIRATWNFALRVPVHRGGWTQEDGLNSYGV
jgi:hypothetical protein